MRRQMPGRPRPNAEVLSRYTDAKSQLLLANPGKGVLIDLFYPEPEALYRWRVLFDCGCVDELLTCDDDPQSLATGSSGDYLSRARLPAGQYLCGASHDDAPPPVQNIVDWGERRVVGFPADPVEPRHDLDPRVWEVIRHAEPCEKAFWMAELTCGHFLEVVTDLEWKPEDGPRHPTTERLEQMRAESAEEDNDGTNYYSVLLRAGWPMPAPFRECRVCPTVRSVTAHERVGWLAPRHMTPAAPNPRTSRTALESQLRRAEAKVGRLRNELRNLPADDT